MVGCRVRMAKPAAGRRGCCAGLELGELGLVLCHCCCVLFGLGGLFLWRWGLLLLRHRRSAGNEGERLERADEPGLDSDRPQQCAEQLSPDIAGALERLGRLEEVTLLQCRVDVLGKLILAAVLALSRTAVAYTYIFQLFFILCPQSPS